ncbi:hypothetical protein FEM03_20700, partial [Phragmitibacter flavus]
MASHPYLNRILKLAATGLMAMSINTGILAQERLYWDGATGATWNDANNWIFFNLSSSVITPGTIPGPEDIPYFDNFGPGDTIGTLGANQSVLGLFFEDLTDPFTIGDLAESFTLSIGTSGIVIGDSGFGSTPVTTAAATINSNLDLTAPQIWANQSATTFTAAGNLTLGANLTLTDDPLGSNNSNGTFNLGSTGKTITNSGGDRTLTVQDTGALVETTIESDIHLTESTTTGRRFTIDTSAGSHVVINGDILNGGVGAAASSFTKTGVGTLTINGDLNYTQVGTAGGTSSGTVITGGGTSTTNINGNINNGAQTWTITGGAGTVLNLASENVTSTGTWVVGTSTQLNFLRNGTTNVTMGGWDLRAGSLTQISTATTLTGNTGVWTVNDSTVEIDGTLNNLTTGTWSLTGTNAAVNINNAATFTTGSWTINQGSVNWTGSGTANFAAAATINLGSTSSDTLASINLSPAAILNLGGNISSRRGSNSLLIDGGTLNLNATRTITVQDNAAVDEDLIITSTITNGSAASGITKAGNGTLTLSGTTSFTGNTTISAGRLLLDYTTQNNSKISSTGTLTLGNGDLELRGHATDATSQTTSSVILTGSGANEIVLTPGAAPLVLNIGDISGGNNTHSLRFVLPTNTTVNTSTAATNFLGAWATMNDGTTDYYAAVGSGKIIAAQATAADNVAQIWAPTLLDQNITDVAGFTGTSDYMNVNTLRISAGNNLNVIENLNLQSGGLLITSDSTATGIHGGTITSSVNSLLVTHHGTQEFEISSDLQRFNDSHGGGLTINTTGDGTLVLSGHNITGFSGNPNVASGLINILDGTLAVAGGNAISDNTTVSLNSPYSTFRIDDNEAIGNLLATGGIVDLQSNDLTVRLSTNQSFGGTFIGDAESTLIKSNMVVATSSGVANNLNISTSNDAFFGAIEVDGGLFHLTGSGSFNNVSSITLNKWGSLLLDSFSSATSTRINNNAAILLNSANGAANAQPTLNRGLWIRNNVSSAAVNEIVGQVTLQAGSNYMLAEATGGNTSTTTTLTMAGLTRENNSTLSMRGTRLGTNATNIQRSAIAITTTGNADETFGNLFRVGGTFANGATAANTQALSGTATNISIVPWVIGEVFGSTQPTDRQSPGNSFVTYNASWGSAGNLGFRPLHLTNEYINYGTAASDGTQNVRSSLTSDTSVLAGKSINTLIINNANTNATAISYTLTAAGNNTLNLTTGAILFTAVGDVNAEGGATSIATASQGGIILNAGQITTSSSEYLMFANNISTAGTTINASLTTAAAFTKSGIGLLTLTGNNTALTSITLNEGTLRINDLDNIGGDTGTITFAGGTLDLSSNYTATDHLTSRTINVIAGNDGRLYITNGKDIQTGTINATDATFIKGGAGILRLTGGAVVNADRFIVEHHQETNANPGVNPQLVLDNADGVNAINADLQIGSGLSNTGTNGTAVVHLQSNEQIVDTAVVSFNATSNLFGYLTLFGHTETIAGIVAADTSSATAGGAAIQNSQDASNTPGSAVGRLILAGSDYYYYGGRIRDFASGTTASQGSIGISKIGSGTQTLAGALITYTGTTIVDAGLLRLRDTTAFNSAITNNATVEIERTNATAWTYNQIISGTGNLRKTGTGTGTTTLAAASTYSGVTDIDAGTLTLAAAGSINNSSAINIKHGATLDVSAKGAAGYDYGHLLTGGGTVTGNINLISGGSLRPGASTNPTAAATTGDQLGALNITGNLGLTGG